MDLAFKRGWGGLAGRLGKGTKCILHPMLRRVWGSINHLRLKRFNLRPVRLKSACTSHPAQEASLGTVGTGCSPGLLAGFGLRCTVFVLRSFLSHPVDGITELSAHDETASRIQPNIWTSLVLQG